jgi:chaperonin GroES
MPAKVRPLNDKILLKRSEAESKTKSGIVLPESAKEKPKRGKVIAIGDGKLLDSGERAKFQVKVGDEVIFASYAGTEIKVDNEELLVLAEDEVLAVVEG